MTDTKTTERAQIPWIRYSEQVDRQVAAGLARENARIANGTPAYRDAGNNERYTVGYGGERHYDAPRPAAKVNGASEKQALLIDKLLVEKEHTYTEEQVVEAKADWRLTRKMIDFLIAAPRVQVRAPAPVVVEAPTAPARTRLNFAEILDGNYAIRVDGVVKFYRVSTGKTGYKNVQVRASDSLFMQYGKAGIAILHRIVETGLAESRMLFATELERCWMCGKSLTDETSRARGTGPDCAAK
jgi:hypothetical protein